MRQIKSLAFAVVMLLSAIALSMGACASIEPKAPEVVCPQMEGYTKEEQESAAKALDAIEVLRAKYPELDTVELFILHYSQLRERLKAVGCQPGARMPVEPAKPAPKTK